MSDIGRPTPPTETPAPDEQRDQPAAVRNDGSDAPPGQGHEAGGGHDDMGKGSSGS